MIGLAVLLFAQAAPAAQAAGAIESAAPASAPAQAPAPDPAQAATQPSQATPAASATPPPSPPAGQSAQATGGHDDALLTAEVWLTQNRFEDARKVLLALEKKPSGQRTRDNQVQFLLGLLDMHDQDYDSAVRRFHRILVSEPNSVRVRLEMGRAYFLAGRYADAERQFMYARAGKVPKTVLANIDRYLGQIRQMKTFTYGYAVAIAPDTNLNAGPATDAVTLYGLPFQLSKNAQANSGVGVVLDTNAEWAPRIGKGLKWRFGGQLHRVQYGATEFDDMTLGGFSGPHLTLRRWDINLLGNIARRWYGDKGYSLNYGPSLDATYYLTTRLGAGMIGNLSQVNYDQIPAQNGLGKTIGLFSFYTPTASSYARVAVTYGHQDAKDASYAFTSWQYGLNYVREFRGGITLGIAPAITLMDYDAPLAAFSTTRRDRQYSAQISLLDRRLDFQGMTPRIAYTFTRNDSDIPLYTFTRNHFEIGLTKSF